MRITFALLFAIFFTTTTIAKEKEWWLHVYFDMDSQIVHGSQIDGWSPRLIGTYELCDQRRAFAQRESERSEELAGRTIWLCQESSTPENF